ncbi:DUF2835 domain-containing protein [Allochromatium tepidum]|uniref:DUF2835 domain-containing protein n=1 Tax=Allochromatium tepidum TaxID=553982 RepID=A0ABN6GCB8_9GAMM|nr:DUF2835 domain-containing protein [Allochromatium tepidum]BCU05825.1 hypothetical protein Atep_05020 [Allochromatium tepidum]
MHCFYFSLNIPRTEYLRYYQGSAARVVVRAHDGRTLSIPAINLRQFVTHAGIQGRFRATIDQNNRLVSLDRQ